MDFTIDSTADVHTVTLEEVLSPKAGSDASKSKTPDGIEERLDEKRREEEEEEEEKEERGGIPLRQADATEEENAEAGGRKRDRSHRRSARRGRRRGRGVGRAGRDGRDDHVRANTLAARWGHGPGDASG